jgi:hypothetical protein
MSSKLSRRSLVTTAAALPALAVPAASALAGDAGDDAELLRLINAARALWTACQAVYKNHDETIETYREMEERVIANFLDPQAELENRIALTCPATLEGLRAKARYALDCGDNLECANTPIFSSIVHDLAERETPSWNKLEDGDGPRLEYAGYDDDGSPLFRMEGPFRRAGSDRSAQS